MQRESLAWRFALALSMTVMLFGAWSFQLVIHEGGHAIVGDAAGGVLSGIVLHVFPALGGHVTSDTPLVEVASSARLWGVAGGPLFSVAAGLIALGFASLRRFRRSVFLVAMAVSSLGGMSLMTLLGGVFAGGREPADILRLGLRLGMDESAIAAGAMVAGLPVTILVGLWYCRRVLEFGFLAAETRRERFSALLWGAWLPLVFLALMWFVHLAAAAGSAKLGVLRKLPLASGLVVALVLGLPVLWLIAWWTKPVETVARPLRPLFASSVACAAIGVAAVLGVGSYFAPPYSPSVETIERRVASAPGDARALRIAAHRLFSWSQREGLAEGERERLAARASELRLEALRLDPENPGALYDVASLHNSDGDEAAERGDWVTARARWSEAFELARKAYATRQDIPAIPARLAQLGEKLEEFERAADYWDRYAAVVAEEEIFPASRKTHVEMAESRSRALRKKIAGSPDAAAGGSVEAP